MKAAFNHDTFIRRKKERIAFIKKYQSTFIAAEKYAKKNGIRHVYDWFTHLMNDEIVKVVKAARLELYYSWQTQDRDIWRMLWNSYLKKSKKMKRFTVDVVTPIERRRRDSFWFDGQVACVVDNKTGRIMSVEATGEIKVMIEDEVLTGEDARKRAHELCYSDTKLNRLEFFNNNWFTLYEQSGTEKFSSVWVPDTVAYTYEDAIRLAKHHLFLKNKI